MTTRHGRAGSERPSGPSHDDNPAVVYRDSLSRGSYWAVHHALVTVAELLDGEGTDPWTFPAVARSALSIPARRPSCPAPWMSGSSFVLRWR